MEVSGSQGSPASSGAQASSGGNYVPSSSGQQSGDSYQQSSGSDQASNSSYDDASDNSRAESERDPLNRSTESKEAEKEAKRWKIKADERDWDLDESELLSYAQKGIGADSRWQEAAKIRQQNNDFLKALRENPREVLSHPQLKLDLKKMAHDILYEDIQNEMMTPEERHYAEREAKLRAYEDRDMQSQRQQHEARQAAEDSRYQTEIDTGIRSSLGSAKIPLTEFTYDSTIKYMQRAMQAGYTDVTPESVLQYVKRDYQKSQEQLFSMDPSEMLDFIGEKGLEKIQKAYIDKVRGKKLGAQQAPEPRQDSRQPERSLSLEEWREDARRRMQADM